MTFSHISKKSGDGLSYYAWFAAMHSRADFLFLSNKSEEELNGITAKVQALIADIETTANCFDSESELSRVNRLLPGDPLQVSERLFSLLTVCKDYHRKTQGLFDVAYSSEPYDVAAIDALLMGKDRQVSKSRAGVYINMSGMLKGYALDGVRELLVGQGIERAFMSFGNSSIMAMGRKPLCEGWPVSCEKDGQTVSLMLVDECLTTSGNETPLRQHIVNPLTKELVTGARKVSVVTKSATNGEVLSTALFASEAQRGALEQAFTPSFVAFSTKA